MNKDRCIRQHIATCLTSSTKFIRLHYMKQLDIFTYKDPICTRHIVFLLDSQDTCIFCLYQWNK